MDSDGAVASTPASRPRGKLQRAPSETAWMTARHLEHKEEHQQHHAGAASMSFLSTSGTLLAAGITTRAVQRRKKVRV